MMTDPIDKYLLAVARRKAITAGKGPSKTVNYAVVSQLENDDIPRLIEIIRVLDHAVDLVIDSSQSDDTSDAVDMAGWCTGAHIKATELADAGSLKQWGNGHNETTEIS